MRREDGFTIVEVLVATIILLAGILTTLTVLDSSRRLTTVAEHQTTLAQRAQAELERVLSLPYNQVALTGTSSQWSSDQSSYTYVNSLASGCPGASSGPAPTYQPDHRTGGSSATEPLVINGCSYTTSVNGNSSTSTPSQGTVPPVTSWSAPLQTGTNATGKVYDFVTWAADPTCSQTPTPGSMCSTADDYKRVTVVVTMDGITHPSHPAIVSGLVTQPSTGRNPVCTGTGCGTTCTDPTTGQTGPCTGAPCPNCTPISTNPCSGSTCGVSCTGTVCTGCTPTTCPGGSGSPPCTQMPAGAVAQSWLTQPVPTGGRWNLTGSGSTSLYLQSNTTTVNASVCIGVYVVPGGLLGGTLPPVGVAYGPTTVPVGTVPTPVTLNFNAGIGPGGYLVGSVAGSLVEVVVWVAANANAVQVVNSPPTYTNQLILNTYS